MFTGTVKIDPVHKLQPLRYKDRVHLNNIIVYIKKVYAPEYIDIVPDERSFAEAEAECETEGRLVRFRRELCLPECINCDSLPANKAI